MRGTHWPGRFFWSDAHSRHHIPFDKTGAILVYCRFIDQQRGIALAEDSTLGPMEEIRQIFKTNFVGTLGLANALVPILAASGGGTIRNILSAAAWLSVPTGMRPPRRRCGRQPMPSAWR